MPKLVKKMYKSPSAVWSNTEAIKPSEEVLKKYFTANGVFNINFSEERRKDITNEFLKKEKDVNFIPLSYRVINKMVINKRREQNAEALLSKLAEFILNNKK